MKKQRTIVSFAWASAIAVALAVGVASASAANGVKGAVFTESNAASGNAILVFDRSGDGTLHTAGSVATGGLGTGSGLGSQGAAILSNDGNELFAVNAGSNDISAFAVKQKDQLTLVAKVGSGGTHPISLTLHDHLLYVLNDGGGVASANISGFKVGNHGELSALANSTRSLSGAAVGPAQIEFAPGGGVLVVTEKGTNSIDTYAVGRNRPLGRPVCAGVGRSHSRSASTSTGEAT